MIRLEVEEYCQACMDFSAFVTNPQRIRLPDGEIGLGDTTVQCEHRRRCASIKRYLERQIKENQEEALG